MAAEAATRQVRVTHSPGIHARPSLAIVTTVRRFRSKVKLVYASQQADAADILPLLSLGVPQGAEVTLTAQGPDAEQVLDALVRLFADNFGVSGD